jgi:hypothetical protein
VLNGFCSLILLLLAVLKLKTKSQTFLYIV